jgi:uncharacterized repeat protein (TIGR03837 family)
MADSGNPQIHCDIFCTVVDNYGDIGVCWRLARQLASELDMRVRLWVDDLRSFGKLCPELNPALEQQCCRGVEVRHWSVDAFQALFSPTRERVTSGEGAVAELVIGAFACQLPQTYLEAMAVRELKPVWLNLDYLSAEDWVEGCHKLPSPHPTLPLTKYFFFPGFTDKTGGLLLERDLLARRDAFQADAAAQARYWERLGVPPRREGELRVSLFGYENAAMAGLLGTWAESANPVTCLVPEGRSVPQVAAFFGRQAGKAGDVWQRGQLRVHVLPFVDQERYDELLWACDVNFVRGEDSCVRAQWAAKPFIWQIYPQDDGVHLEKLEALRKRYSVGLPPATSAAVKTLWLAWNGGADMAGAWTCLVPELTLLTRHGKEWSARLSGNNLALNLLDYYRKTACSENSAN